MPGRCLLVLSFEVLLSFVDLPKLSEFLPSRQPQSLPRHIRTPSNQLFQFFAIAKNFYLGKKFRFALEKRLGNLWIPLSIHLRLTQSHPNSFYHLQREQKTSSMSYRVDQFVLLELIEPILVLVSKFWLLRTFQ